MKNMATFLSLISILICSLTPAWALDDVTPQKVEEVREMLVKEFNTLSELDNENWESFFTTQAELFEAKGDLKKAEAAVSMADPALRPEILKLYKEKIDNLSENGLILIFAALFAAADDDYYYEEEPYYVTETYYVDEVYYEYDRYGYRYRRVRRVPRYRRVRRVRRVRHRRRRHHHHHHDDAEVALILIILTLGDDTPAQEV